jgi:hypothetical protein
VVRILRRIGRGDLANRVSGDRGGSPLVAWRERQAIERQVMEPELRLVADRPAAPAFRSERSDVQGP